MPHSGIPAGKSALCRECRGNRVVKLPTCCSPPLGHALYLSFFGFLHLTGIQVAVQ